MAPAAPCLQWKDDGDRIEVFRLEADEVFVGRREGAGLVLRHPEVSRRHARIYREAEGIFVADLESTHGTWVNGAHISRHLLRSGDRIRFGVNGPELTLRTGAADSGAHDSLQAMGRAVDQFTASRQAAPVRNRRLPNCRICWNCSIHSLRTFRRTASSGIF